MAMVNITAMVTAMEKKRQMIDYIKLKTFMKVDWEAYSGIFLILRPHVGVIADVKFPMYINCL